MTRILLSLAVTLLVCTGVSAQCPANLLIRSDSDVRDFRNNYPHCTQLRGDLRIQGGQISSLKGLSVLTSVGGEVLIERLNLKSITGLEQINRVGGNYTLQNCQRLSGAGFAGHMDLTSIGGRLTLKSLPSLTSFIPLNRLSSLYGGLDLEDLRIRNVDPLSRLRGPMKILRLNNNSGLSDISALNGVTAIGRLEIVSNRSLGSCAITPVCSYLSVGGTSTITGNRSGCASVAQVELVCGICHHPDYEALAALYNSTDGDNWNTNDEWLANCDPCTWWGVHCTNDRVTRLLLSNNNLTGSLPDEIRGLTELRQLWLFDNTIHGRIPQGFQSLQNLEILRIENNNFDTPLYLSINALAGSQSLMRLNMGNNAFYGYIPFTIGRFPALEELHLYENELTGGIPAEIGDLSELRSLGLTDNPSISGVIPGEIGNLVNLRFLHLRNTGVSGTIPESIGLMSSLRTIDASNNYLFGDFPDLSENLQLYSVKLNNNFLNGPLENIELPNDLEYLNLADNYFTGPLPSIYLNYFTPDLYLDFRNNYLDGCYPNSYEDFCGLSPQFSGNTFLPDGGSSTFFNNNFCNSQQACDNTPAPLRANGSINQTAAGNEVIMQHAATELTSDFNESGSITAHSNRLAPNPTSGTFSVRSNVDQPVTLFAADGRLLRTILHRGTGGTVVDEALPAGLYWVRFTVSGEVQKLVVR